MKIAVSGSRNWRKRGIINDALASEGHNGDIVITGWNGNADKMADSQALQLGWHPVRVPPNWMRYGKGAGVIRNGIILALQPDVVLAFIRPCVAEQCRDDGPHPSHGTADMISKARLLGIRVREFEDPDDNWEEVIPPWCPLPQGDQALRDIGF